LKQLNEFLNYSNKNLPIDKNDMNELIETILSEVNDIALEESDSDFLYSECMEKLRIHELVKDEELNDLYSYYIFFDKNFIVPLSPSYIKFDFNLSKKRDEVIQRADMIKQQLKQFQNDYEMTSGLHDKDKNVLRERMGHQRTFLFIKIGEFIRFVDRFADEVQNDLVIGRKSLFNPEMVFEMDYENLDIKVKPFFHGKKYVEIIKEMKSFTKEFIEELRIPDLKN